MTLFEYQREMMAVYREETGRPVHMSVGRNSMLKQMMKMEIGIGDARAVLRWLKRSVAGGALPASSLDFRNAMKPEAMEDRLLRLREARERGRGVKREGVVVGQARKLPDGRTETVLTAPGAADLARMDELVKKQMDAFREKMRGGPRE